LEVQLQFFRDSNNSRLDLFDWLAKNLCYVQIRQKMEGLFKTGWWVELWVWKLFIILRFCFASWKLLVLLR